MKHDLNKIYENYGSLINEQSATLSADANARLKEYLQDDLLIEELADTLSKLEQGESYEINLDREEFGIKPDDRINVNVMIEDGKPKFYMSIINDEVLFGGIDFELAADILYQAGQEGSVIGSVGNYIGSLFGVGDAGDAGTDEETVASVAAAMAKIAANRGSDPKMYYDKLTTAFESKHGSLVDFLNTEFSGRAEAVALSTFRQPVESSVTRGMNLGSILFDIGLTIATFGTGTVIKSSLKGAAGAAANVLSKAKVGSSAVAAGSKVLTGAKGVISRFPAWSKLGPATKAEHLGKSIKVGEKIKYTTKTGKNAGRSAEYTVQAITSKGVQLSDGSLKFIAKSDDIILGVSPGLANKILNAAKINATTAGIALATKKTSDLVDSVSGTQEEASMFGKASEIMGWYDTLTADPNAFLGSLQGQGADSLAQLILDLKKGSGLFGNTTDQEELMMALIIISLTPKGAAEVKEYYSKLDPKMTIYAVLDDEIGGDLGIFAKAYWSAVSGEGAYVSPINSIIARIKK